MIWEIITFLLDDKECQVSEPRRAKLCNQSRENNLDF